MNLPRSNTDVRNARGVNPKNANADGHDDRHRRQGRFRLPDSKPTTTAF